MSSLLSLLCLVLASSSALANYGNYRTASRDLQVGNAGYGGSQSFDSISRPSLMSPQYSSSTGSFFDNTQQLVDSKASGYSNYGNADVGSSSNALPTPSLDVDIGAYSQTSALAAPSKLLEQEVTYGSSESQFSAAGAPMQDQFGGGRSSNVQFDQRRPLQDQFGGGYGQQQFDRPQQDQGRSAPSFVTRDQTFGGYQQQQQRAPVFDQQSSSSYGQQVQFDQRRPLQDQFAGGYGQQQQQQQQFDRPQLDQTSSSYGQQVQFDRPMSNLRVQDQMGGVTRDQTFGGYGQTQFAPRASVFDQQTSSYGRQQPQFEQMSMQRDSVQGY